MPPPHSLQRISPATPPAGPHSPSPVCLLPVSHSGCGDAPALSSHRLTTPSGAVTAFNLPKLSREHSTRVVGPLLRMSLKPWLSHRGQTQERRGVGRGAGGTFTATQYVALIIYQAVRILGLTDGEGTDSYPRTPHSAPCTRPIFVALGFYARNCF